MPGEADGPEIVVIGASAGGVDALVSVLGELPADLPAAVFVVLHMSSTSVLPTILARRCSLSTDAAVDGEPVVAGRVYVATPGRHLMVERGRVRLVAGPRENRHRPAVDALFRSAAEAYGRNVVGVILSGSGDDGTAGLRHITSRGGRAVVQDPEEAAYPGMPRSATDHVDVDRIAPLDALGATIVELIGHEGDEEEGGISEMPVDNPGPEPPAAAEPTPPDPRARHYACPECGGVLSETDEVGMLRFVCHTGHIYSPESLLEAQGDVLESAMWAAVRSLKERAALLRRIAARTAGNDGRWHRGLGEQADAAQLQAQTLRDAILHLRSAAADPVDA
jgi:two-component system chemotaxis response regulator CheB